MAYLRTADAVRAHMVTNADQFAAQGNPWDGDGAPKIVRAKPARKRGKRHEPRSLRPTSETFTDIKAMEKLRREWLAHTGKSRTVAPVERERLAPTVSHMKPVNNAELHEWHPERIETDIRRHAAASAKARRDCDAVKLDQMQQALAKFGKKMAKVI